MSDLARCPFCGGGAEDDYMHDDDQCGGHGAVYCVEGCGAEVYGDTVRYRGQEPTKEAMQASKQSAIAAWNTRTPDPLLAEMAEALRAAKEAWIAYETARTTQDHHAAVARIRFALGIEELEND